MNWVGKNSEIRWKRCHSLLCACRFWQSLICLSLEEKIDMAEVLSYSLTFVTLSLSYSDGSM